MRTKTVPEARGAPRTCESVMPMMTQEKASVISVALKNRLQ